MCGIAGYWSKDGKVDRSLVELMVERIRHRGPDDGGVWLDSNAGIALGHRRLAIIDLSSAGRQPMTSPCGRFTLVYNGEIYNNQELRKELELEGGHFEWRGHSDTETLLSALRHWGVKGALRRLNGMFALALWDGLEHTLAIARDRMGEKPFYYGRSGNTFLFGSQLKALTVHPDWRGEIDLDALTWYLRYSYIPAPFSIYRGISKLLPGHYMIIRDQSQSVFHSKCYWSLRTAAEAGANDDFVDTDDVIRDLDALLRDAVKRRMASDVPLGVFLSGGVDSSTVAALMQVQSALPIKTFSIGFYEKAYNEAKYAKIVAEHLGTDHTELYVSQDEAMATIPGLPKIWDEPFSDSSQIPMYLVSELARRHVTVSLSGDGGDELFCGYNRYTLGYNIWSQIRKFPVFVRKLLCWVLAHVPMKKFEYINNLMPSKIGVSLLRDQLPKLIDVLTYKTDKAFYQRLVSHWKEPEQIVLGGKEPEYILDYPEKMPDLLCFREKMMYFDALTYLPDDILVKVDRASMAVSLEARAPLLDHRVVEFAWKIPMGLKYRDGKGKWILREVLAHYLPRELMDRPKKGFDVPIEQWLCGPLREWAETLLDEKRLRDEGVFEPNLIRRKWEDHISGRRRWHYHLWDILMFQAWRENDRKY